MPIIPPGVIGTIASGVDGFPHVAPVRTRLVHHHLVQPETGGDVFLVSMSGAFELHPLVATEAYEGSAQLSPDVRWLLYQSDDSGPAEI